MPRLQKRLTMVLFVLFLFLLSTGAQASSPPPFEVVSLRVEKAPNECRSTLFATIKNNTQTTTDSGLFVYASQFKDLGNGQQMTSPIGSVRLDNLPAGQTREISFTYFRERAKTGASFRFRIGAGTVAFTEKPLPPVLEQYIGKVETVYDKAKNILTGTVTNPGGVPLPRPSVNVYLAPLDKPDSYKGGGGGIITDCLGSGESVTFTRQMFPEAVESVIRVDLSADGMVLDTQFHGKPSALTPKRLEKRAPKVRSDLKTIKP